MAIPVAVCAPMLVLAVLPTTNSPLEGKAQTRRRPSTTSVFPSDFRNRRSLSSPLVSYPYISACNLRSWPVFMKLPHRFRRLKASVTAFSEGFKGSLDATRSETDWTKSSSD